MKAASILARAVPPSTTTTTCRLRSAHPIPRPLPIFHSATTSRRNFSSSWGSSPAPQTLTATRTLPYSAKACYELITDIDKYHHFIPYCTSSRITSQSGIESKISGRSWPRTVELTVGYGPYTEVFRSRVFCKPYSVLEAVAGDAETSIPRYELWHYFQRGADESGRGEEKEKARAAMANHERAESLFTTLSTRWTFVQHTYGSSSGVDVAGSMGGTSVARQEQQHRPGQMSTEINLSIKVAFKSVMYAALSQAAAPKVAGFMIEAFEKRAREVYGSLSEQ